MGRSVFSGLRKGLRVRFSSVRSEGRHRGFDELHTTARIVIGVFQSTDLDDQEIADLLEVPVDVLRDFHASLCRDEEVSKILSDGMPGIYGAWLPSGKTVKCCDCGGRISFVPCVRCWEDRGGADRTPDHERADMPDCADPVTLRPGSGEKIEVMQSRVSQGFSPFCQGDRWDGPREPWLWDSESSAIDDRPEDEQMFCDFLEKLERRRNKPTTRMVA